MGTLRRNPRSNFGRKPARNAGGGRDAETTFKENLEKNYYGRNGNGNISGILRNPSGVS